MIKPWIENVALGDVKSGNHYEAGLNSMLIQIVDNDTEFPKPRYDFKEVRQYKFLDVENTDIIKYGSAINDEQAKDIVESLKFALKNHMNVVVHCHYGICRSGAVAEVGVMLGFTDTEKFRSPNLMVKHKLLEQLGMAYDPNEPNSANGKAFVYDELNNKIYY